MKTYPSIPFYKKEEIDALKMTADRKHSVILPTYLWNRDRFRNLPDGSKLLYGIIMSKMANDDAAPEQGGRLCVRLPIKRIQELLGCSKKTAQLYLRKLSDFGYITVESASSAGTRGKHNRIVQKRDFKMSGEAAVIIPIPLFSLEKFTKLPDGAKLLYGLVFADMVDGKAFSDTNGNCCIFFPAEKFKLFCGYSTGTRNKYKRLLRRHGFIREYRFKISKNGTGCVTLMYIRRLTG